MTIPPRDNSYGPTAVGLLALRNREFFAKLMKDPEGAMRAEMKTGRLKLSDDDIKAVVSLMEERNRVRPHSDPMQMWVKYQATLTWDDKDWPMGWPTWGSVRRP